MIAMLVCVLSAARYGNVLDYAGPNLSSNQLIVYTPNGPAATAAGPGNGGGRRRRDRQRPASPQAATADSIGGRARLARRHRAGIHQRQRCSTPRPAASGRGPVYVATPQLLAAFGIKASQVNPDADILSMRPGLSGLSQMQLTYGNYGNGPGNGPGNGQNQTFPCPASECLANPVIQQEGAPAVRHVGPQHGDHRARDPASSVWARASAPPAG